MRKKACTLSEITLHFLACVITPRFSLLPNAASWSAGSMQGLATNGLQPAHKPNAPFLVRREFHRRCKVASLGLWDLHDWSWELWPPPPQIQPRKKYELLFNGLIISCSYSAGNKWSVVVSLTRAEQIISFNWSLPRCIIVCIANNAPISFRFRSDHITFVRL